MEGGLGRVFDQDFSNLKMVQKGLKTCSPAKWYWQLPGNTYPPFSPDPGQIYPCVRPAMNDLFKPFCWRAGWRWSPAPPVALAAISAPLARAGAKVVLAARRADRVQAACQEIAAGGEALTVTMDVTDSASIGRRSMRPNRPSGR